MRALRALFPGMAAMAAMLGFFVLFPPLPPLSVDRAWAAAAPSSGPASPNPAPGLGPEELAASPAQSGPMYSPAQETMPLVSPVTARAQCPATGLPARAARACAEAAARLKALHTAAEALPGSREIRMGLADAAERLTMAAHLYSPLVSHDDTPGAPWATVTLLARPNAAQSVSLALHNPQLSVLRFLLLQEYEALLEAAGTTDATERQTAPGAGGAWYRARVRPPGAPPEDTPGAAPAPPAWEVLADKFEALSRAQDALHISPEGWLARPEALPSLKEAAEALPHSPALRLLLAEAQLQRGLPQQSIASCSEALRLAPGMDRAHYIRALAHWRLQQPALAEDDLKASLEGRHGQAPQNQEKARRLRARGALRMLRHNYAGMCADFVAACALGDCEGLSLARTQNHCLGGQEEGTDCTATPDAHGENPEPLTPESAKP